MKKGVRRWFLPGMGLGWGIVLLVLAGILPFNPHFIDEPLLAVLVMMVVPALLGGGVALLIAAIGGRVLRTRRRLDEVWVTRARRAMLLCGLGLLVVCVTSWLAPPRTLNTRLLIYGVDGATFDILDTIRPLGMTPNLDRMMERGASGKLRSVEPLLSPILWTTIASGQPIEKHGIAGFHTTNPECKAARIWDIAESHGMVVGMYKWLVTYPPREVRGFMVPGWLATGTESHPADLGFARSFEQGQKARTGGKANAGGAPVDTVGPLGFAIEGTRHGLRLSTLAAATRLSLEGKFTDMHEGERLLKVHMLRAQIDRDLFLGLMERYDPAVATFTYYPTDAVAHRSWRYYEPDKFGGVDAAGRDLWDSIPATYRQADDFLADFQEYLPASATVMILSDHGMQPAGKNGSAIFGIRGGQVKQQLEDQGAVVDVAQVGMKVTVAVGADSPVAAEAVKELLAQFTVAGKPMFFIEELSDGVLGLTMAIGGDLAAKAGETVQLPDGEPLPLEQFLRTRADFSGVHQADGVILISGPNIRASELIDGADLYDVAPTALATLGLPPSADMPGRVLENVFVEAPELPDGPESYSDLLVTHDFVVVEGSATGDAALEERLRALGYVDSPGEDP